MYFLSLIRPSFLMQDSHIIKAAPFRLKHSEQLYIGIYTSLYMHSDLSNLSNHKVSYDILGSLQARFPHFHHRSLGWRSQFRHIYRYFINTGYIIISIGAVVWPTSLAYFVTSMKVGTLIDIDLVNISGYNIEQPWWWQKKLYFTKKNCT